MTYKEKLNECLAAIKRGDQTKFNDLVRLTYGPLITVAKRYLFDKSCAEMVVSDLYYRIYIYADHYDTSKDALTYLWQIVKRKAYDYNKQYLKNNAANIDEVQLTDAIDPYERVNAKIDIADALRRIGVVNTMIIVWTYRDGLTQEEIGQILSISKSAVCQRLNKIKKKLLDYLK